MKELLLSEGRRVRRRSVLPPTKAVGRKSREREGVGGAARKVHDRGVGPNGLSGGGWEEITPSARQRRLQTGVRLRACLGDMWFSCHCSQIPRGGLPGGGGRGREKNRVLHQGSLGEELERKVFPRL